jgi:hypothetical protein
LFSWDLPPIGLDLSSAFSQKMDNFEGILVELWLRGRHAEVVRQMDFALKKKTALKQKILI